MTHVVNSETGIPVARLMNLVDENGFLKVQARWRGLTHSEDTLEPLENLY